MLCNSTIFTAKTSLNFLKLVKHNAASRPAAWKTFQQFRLGIELNFQSSREEGLVAEGIRSKQSGFFIFVKASEGNVGKKFCHIKVSLIKYSHFPMCGIYFYFWNIRIKSHFPEDFTKHYSLLIRFTDTFIFVENSFFFSDPIRDCLNFLHAPRKHAGQFVSQNMENSGNIHRNIFRTTTQRTLFELKLKTLPLLHRRHRSFNS